MVQNLDEIDLKILRVVQFDSAVSMDRLAERAGLSRNACWRRVKQLEESGVIRGRVAVVDPVAVDLGLAVFIHIRTNEHAPDWLEMFDTAVRTLPEILGAYRMTGELDYLLRVRVKDVAGYDRFYKRLIAMVPIADISANFVMEEIKETTALPV